MKEILYKDRTFGGKINSKISRERMFLKPSEGEFITTVDQVSGSLFDNCSLLLCMQNF